MRTFLFLLLAGLANAAQAAVQEMTCTGETVNITFQIPQRGKVTSRYARNTFSRVRDGANVVVTGQDRVASLNDNEGSATSITFPSEHLGAPGTFEARGEYCTTECLIEPVTCTSEIK